MKKFLLILVTLILALGIFVVAAKDSIAKAAIVNGVKAMTGLGLRIRSVDIGITRTYLDISGLEILNPDGFKEETLAELPRVYADYDLPGFFKGKTHLNDLKIDLSVLTVVRNSSGRVNIETVREAVSKPGGKPPQFQIDSLGLKVGKVIYKDYVAGNPDVKEFAINMDENFKNVNDPKELTSLIIVKALSKTSIPGLANLDMNEFKSKISSELSSQVQNQMEQLKEKAQGVINKAEDKLQQLLKPSK